MASASYVMAMLRVMRRRTGQAFSPAAIWELLYLEERFPHRGYFPSPKGVHDAMTELEELGVLARVGEERWSLREGIPHEPIQAGPAGDDAASPSEGRAADQGGLRGNGGDDGGGGGGDGDNDGGQGGGADDGRGGGLAEVVAHPVLFSTGEDGLAAALDAALKG